MLRLSTSPAKRIATGAAVFAVGLCTVYGMADRLSNFAFLVGPIVLAAVAGFVIDHWGIFIVVVLVDGLAFLLFSRGDWYALIPFASETSVYLMFMIWPSLAAGGALGWIGRRAWSYGLRSRKRSDHSPDSGTP